jgi:hypothetical protein
MAAIQARQTNNTLPSVAKAALDVGIHYSCGVGTFRLPLILGNYGSGEGKRGNALEFDGNVQRWLRDLYGVVVLAFHFQHALADHFR